MWGMIVTAALLAPADAAPEDTELLRRAFEAFAAGLLRREAGEGGQAHFRRAAADLEELRRRGVNNVPLYRNLGNAYVLAGNLPRAILAYRLGLRLDPGNARLREALAAAREQVAFPEGESMGRPPELARPPWLPLLGPTYLLALAGLGYALGCVCLTRWLMHRRGGMLAAGLASLALVAVPTVALIQQRKEHDRPIAVVSRDGVLLRMGNGMSFPPWSETPLNRGVEAELLFRRDGWLQVRLLSGEVGWVREAETAVADAAALP